VSPAWSYLLAAIGIAGLLIAANAPRVGWWFNIAAQLVWITYAVATRQWGFLASAFGYGVAYARLLRRAYRAPAATSQREKPAAVEERPGPYELWKQTGGQTAVLRRRYRDLLAEHGHLVLTAHGSLVPLAPDDEVAAATVTAMTDQDKPGPYELWKQAGGGTDAYDRQRYRALLIEHGHLVPSAPGEKAEPLPCGWPHNRYPDDRQSNPWAPYDGYHEALMAGIRDGSIVDPDFWFNPETDDIERRATRLTREELEVERRRNSDRSGR
jgi:hypothetical protein